MKKLIPEKGLSDQNQQPSQCRACPSCRGAQMPLPGSLPRNQGRPPCPQRVRWHMKCHLHNSHKPTLPYAAHGERTRATFSQSITHLHSLYFISGPGILPLDSFMASKCPLTLNTEPWTRSLSGTDHRLLYPVSRVSQRRLCAWALVGDCDGRMKGWDDEVGGTRKGYNEMLGFS